jgi:trehalose 6-phosphate phosphatase
VLRALAARYKTAIVSGRARMTAHGLVQLDELYYAGSHGFDIAGPQRKPHEDDGETQELEHIRYSAADSYRPALEAAKAKVEEVLGDVKGVVVEDNTFSVSVRGQP